MTSQNSMDGGGVRVSGKYGGIKWGTEGPGGPEGFRARSESAIGQGFRALAGLIVCTI